MSDCLCSACVFVFAFLRVLCERERELMPGEGCPGRDARGWVDSNMSEPHALSTRLACMELG